eukprot:11171649-Lingulodinium_polyedra.AAC.1
MRRWRSREAQLDRRAFIPGAPRCPRLRPLPMRGACGVCCILARILFSDGRVCQGWVGPVGRLLRMA